MTKWDVALLLAVALGFLAVGMSHGESEAMAEPPAFVQGPMHRTVASKIVHMLVRSNPQTMFDNPTVLIVGDDDPTIWSLCEFGMKTWKLKTTLLTNTEADVVGRTRDRLFPFQKHVLDVVLYELTLPTETSFLVQMIVDVGMAIKIGGYFVVPDSDANDVPGLFKRLNFFQLPFTFQHQYHKFSIYQKQASIHNGGKSRRAA